MTLAIQLAIAILEDAGYVIIPRDVASDIGNALANVGHGVEPDKDKCLKLAVTIRRAYMPPRLPPITYQETQI